MLENEILLIILQNFLFFNFFLFPRFIQSSLIDKLSIYDQACINILIFSNILLISSFFQFQYKYLFIALFIISLFYSIANIRNIIKNINLKFLIFFILTITLSLNIAYELEFDWDTKTFWYLKVLNFFQENSIDNLRLLPVPDWPHLGPFIWSFFWKFPFEYNEYFGRLFFNFLYIISIFSVSECFSKKFFFQLLLTILIILITYNYNFFSGEQDIFVFSLLIIITKMSFFIFKENLKKYEKNFFLIFILLSFNLLCWIKLEGIIFSGIVTVSLIFFKNLKKKQKTYFISIFLIILILKYTVSKYFGLNVDPKWFELTETLNINLKIFIDKLKTLSIYLIYYSFNLPLYLITFGLLFIAVFKKFKFTNHDKFLFLLLLFNTLFMIVAFMFKSDDIEKQIRNSLFMFMFGSSGFYVLLMINLLSKFNFEKKLI